MTVVVSLLALILAAGDLQAKPESRRDGRITFVVGESGDIGPTPRLVVMDADGTNKRVRLGWVVNASLSPDGRFIAYNVWGSGWRDTRKINADGRLRDRLLVRNGQDADWSPTGAAIAFVRGGDIWIKDLRSQTERRVARHAVTGFGELDWSPDGKKLAYDRGHDVWVVDLVSKRVHPLIRGAGNVRRAAHARWSPDGHRIAFERGVGLQGYIYIARADGTAEKRVAEGGSPAWSPDGRELAFAEFSRISLIHVDGTHRRVVYVRLEGRACCAPFDLEWAR
jgi:Tol biopolymer transport system component